MEKTQENILKLLDLQGFIDYYYKICLDFDTNQEAYERVESIHLEYFGKRKYSNYNSFRSVRNRNLKNKK